MFKFQPLVAVFAMAALMPLLASAEIKEDAKMMKKCALACATCQIECDSCFAHCLQLVADGKRTTRKRLSCARIVLNAARHV